MSSAIKLRPDQAEVLGKVRQSIQRGNRSVLVQMPTGAGKTVLAAEIVRRFREKDSTRSVWVAVHYSELLDQWDFKLRAAGIPGGQIGRVVAGQPVGDEPVKICMYLTLANRLKSAEVGPPEMLFVDEAHRSRSSTFQFLIDATRQAGGLVVGLTATPARTDGQGLGDGLYDDLVCGKSISELIDLGALADYQAMSVSCGLKLDGVEVLGGDYEVSGLAKVSSEKSVIRSVIDIYEANCSERKTLIFAVNIQHAETLAFEMRIRGLQAATLHSGKTNEDNAESLSSFRRGDCPALISVGMLNEGFDCPDADAVLLARKTQSIIVHYQQIGRCLRPKTDGRDALIVDAVGNLVRHGTPRKTITWTLDGCGWPRKKARAFECEHCGFVHDSPFTFCLKCGREPSLKIRKKHVDEDLEVVPLTDIQLSVLHIREKAGAIKKNNNGTRNKAQVKAAWNATGGELFLQFYLMDLLGWKEGAVYARRADLGQLDFTKQDYFHERERYRNSRLKADKFGNVRGLV